MQACLRQSLPRPAGFAILRPNLNTVSRQFRQTVDVAVRDVVIPPRWRFAFQGAAVVEVGALPPTLLRQILAFPRRIRSRTFKRRARIDLTNPEVALPVAQHTSLFKRILSFPRRQPFIFQLGLNTVVVCTADLSMQFLDGKSFSEEVPSSERIDSSRLMMFALFGAVQAGVSWFVYINIFKALFPRALSFANMTWKQKLADRKGQLDVLKQNFCDCFIYVPGWFFPNFYFFKTMIQGAQWHDPVELLKSTFDVYRQNFWSDNIGYCCMWMPANIVIFSVPVWLRLPSAIALNYVFTVLLSYFRGTSEQDGTPLQEA